MTKKAGIKLDAIGQSVSDNYTVFQHENTFCLYIRRESEKLKYQTQQDNMFKLIHHELRTPIENFSEGALLISDMLKGYENNSNVKESFHSLVKATINSATKVSTKIEKLLELSETYGDDPMRNKERVNLVEVTQSAIDSLSEMSTSKGIIIKLKQKGDIIGNLYGSFGWLKRAITECVQNSIEHSHSNSEIHLELRQNSYFAHINIRDFGRGISPKIKNRLFKPFFGGADKDVSNSQGQDESQGLGIGLSLAKTIVKNHGGNIRCIEIKNGVEFHIELPTGGDKSSSNDLDIRQSQLYARDMALLMSKVTKTLL
jgi:signal transduction histidine kinase